MRKRTKGIVATAIALPLVVAGGSTAYASYYSDRALPGSSVAGLSVSGMTRSEVAAAVRARAARATLQITTPTGTRTASLADLGYAVDVDATARGVVDPDRTWPSYARAPFTSHSADVVTRHDPKAFDAYVQRLAGTSIAAPTNAKVVLAKDKKSFVVKPARSGRGVDPAALRSAAAASARTLKPGTATVRLVERAPAVSTAAATTVSRRANSLVRHSVRVRAGSLVLTATAREKASWVTFRGSGAALAPAVDESKVAAWVTRSGTVHPVNGTRYVSSKGKVVRVLVHKRDGARVTGSGQTAKAVVADLAAGRNARGQVATTRLRATWTERRLAPGAERLAYPAIPGEKWIDVNLGRHTMTAYVGGKKVYGPVAMVNGAPATPTDVGTFHIYLKNATMTMRGRNADGTDYETPNVPWSSFFNGGEALHGAYWRSSFGYAASHGCVNLPIPTAKWVYDWAPIGTPVVTHY